MLSAFQQPHRLFICLLCHLERLLCQKNWICLVVSNLFWSSLLLNLSVVIVLRFCCEFCTIWMLFSLRIILANMITCGDFWAVWSWCAAESWFCGPAYDISNQVIFISAEKWWHGSLGYPQPLVIGGSSIYWTASNGNLLSEDSRNSWTYTI